MRVLWGTPRVVIYGIIAGTVASGSVSAQETVRVGGVTALTGSAIAVRTNAEDVLALNDPIFKNDILETGAGGKLRVTFADDTQLTLGPDAEVIIDEFVYAPDKKAAMRRFVSPQAPHASLPAPSKTTAGRLLFPSVRPLRPSGFAGRISSSNLTATICRWRCSRATKSP